MLSVALFNAVKSSRFSFKFSTFPNNSPKHTPIAWINSDLTERKGNKKAMMIEASCQLHITSLWLNLLRDAERNTSPREERKEVKQSKYRRFAWEWVELTFIRRGVTRYSFLGVKCVLGALMVKILWVYSVHTLSPWQLQNDMGEAWGWDVKGGRKRNYKQSADVKKKVKKPLEHDAAALCRSLPSPAFNQTSFYSLFSAVLCGVLFFFPI